MIALDTGRLLSGAECAPLVAAAKAAQAIHLPAILAGASDQIDVTFLTQAGGSLPLHLSKASRAHLIIIGDDPGGYGNRRSLGPTGWRCAKRLQSFQPRFCYVHGSGGKMADYAAAVDATRGFGRVVMVECGSSQAAAWGRLMKRHCSTIVQHPTDGLHPIQETVH